MASKGKEIPKEAEASIDMETHPIEKLQDENGVSAAVHVGTCLHMGWSRGKEVTREEYLQAVKRFRDSAGRSRHA